MDYMEFKGKTKGEAITEACTYFSIPSDRLDYKVIDEGKTGFLGMGARPAVIRAKVKEEDSEVIEPVKLKFDEAPDAVDAIVKESVSNTVNINMDVEAVSKKFLNDVFEAMHISVDVSTKYNESLNTLDVELSGDEMGVLIGKRGQTLDSLQYLISLVINKGTEEYLKVKVDTENYRQRRRDTLENLAKNIAYKVKRTRRSVSLEPMNPYERRIIHSALQNDRFVTTHSEGDEPFRRVVIVPKRDNSYGDNRGGYRSNSRGSYGRDRNKSYNRSYSRSNRSYDNDKKKDYVRDNEESSFDVNQQ